MTRKVMLKRLWFLSVILAGSACGSGGMEDPAPVVEAAPVGGASDGDDTTAAGLDDRGSGGREGPPEAATAPAFGEPIGGLSAAELARFEAGKEEFSSDETAEEGLGPVFNDTSCAKCHRVPAIGGGDTRLETRFGTRRAGRFDPMAYAGGSLIQENAIGIAGECNFVAELVPGDATMVSKRRSTPLFGLGLVDAVPDDAFQRLARSEQRLFPREAGRVGMVRDIAAGRNRPGRFGWKGQVPSLHQFSGDAYLNEMGITTPEFPDESCPQGDCTLLRVQPPARRQRRGRGGGGLPGLHDLPGPAAARRRQPRRHPRPPGLHHHRLQQLPRRHADDRRLPLAGAALQVLPPVLGLPAPRHGQPG